MSMVASTSYSCPGSFIALYKLTMEYHDHSVNDLDLFMTTVEMRRQRKKMIQKPEQYRYVLKCLGDYVHAQVSGYA